MRPDVGLAHPLPIDAELDFRLLSMTELRTSPGEILDRVAESGQAFLIERNGKRKACLVPLSAFFPDIPPARIAQELTELESHGEHPRTTIAKNREIVFCFAEDAHTPLPIELKVVLPHGYPNRAPRVYASPIGVDAPHRRHDGELCLYGPSTAWNPGKHTVVTAIELARAWLRRYHVWCETNAWPQ